MPTYLLRLNTESGPDEGSESQVFADDASAIREASKAAGELLLSEMAEGVLVSEATVRVERDGTPIAVVKATATVERLT